MTARWVNAHLQQPPSEEGGCCKEKKWCHYVLLHPRELVSVPQGKYKGSSKKGYSIEELNKRAEQTFTSLQRLSNKGRRLIFHRKLLKTEVHDREVWLLSTEVAQWSPSTWNCVCSKYTCLYVFSSKNTAIVKKKNFNFQHVCQDQHSHVQHVFPYWNWTTNWCPNVWPGSCFILLQRNV